MRIGNKTHHKSCREQRKSTYCGLGNQTLRQSFYAHRQLNASAIVLRASSIVVKFKCTSMGTIIGNQTHRQSYATRKLNASSVMLHASEVKCIANHRKSKERTSEVKCIANRAILVYVYILVYLICGRFIKNDDDFIACLLQHLQKSYWLLF